MTHGTERSGMEWPGDLLGTVKLQQEKAKKNPEHFFC